MNTNSSSVLWQAADEIEDCIPAPDSWASKAPGKFWKYVGERIDRVLSAEGAFPEYDTLRTWIGRTKLDNPDNWQDIAFIEAVTSLTPGSDLH